MQALEKDNKEKNSKKQKKRLAYTLIILLVLSAIYASAYFLKQAKEKQYYNDFLVQKSELGYMTKLYIANNPYLIETKYHPMDVEDIKIDFNPKSVIKNKQHIYVAIDPYDTRLTGKTTIAGMELKALIEPFFKTAVTSAFTKEKNNYTLKTCPEQNKTEAVFLLAIGNETKIFKNDNCIILEAITQEDLIKEADAVIFRLLSITK